MKEKSKSQDVAQALLEKKRQAAQQKSSSSIPIPTSKIVSFLTSALVIAFFIGLLLISRQVYSRFYLEESTRLFHLDQHGKEKCKKLGEDVHGAEDIAINHQMGIAYISSDDRESGASLFSSLPAKGHPDGGIYLLDLRDPDAVPIKLNITGRDDVDFHPHGISVFFNPSAHPSARLFVINHSVKEGHCIEVYDHVSDDLLDEEGNERPVSKWGKLALAKRFKHDLVIQPNDIVAVGPLQFMITNDHGSSWRAWQLVEDLFGFADGSFVYCHMGTEPRFPKDKLVTPADCTFMATKLAFPNGINIAPDGRYVYVASSFDRSIKVYVRVTSDGVASYVANGSVPVGTVADNIDVDPKTGHLYVAGHPSLSALVRYVFNNHHQAPSQILKLSFDRVHRQWNKEELYLSDGEDLSASSVAAYHQGQILVGSIRSRGILRCYFQEAAEQDGGAGNIAEAGDGEGEKGQGEERKREGEGQKTEL